MSFLLRNAPQIFVSAEEILKKYRDLVSAAYHKAMLDVSYEQWSVLNALANRQGLTQIEIANDTLKEPASISRILKLLTKKGLVQRLDDKQNRRAKRVYLTPNGIEVQRVATRLFNEIAKEGFNGVHDQEINLFVRILDKIQNNLSPEEKEHNR